MTDEHLSKGDTSNVESNQTSSLSETQIMASSLKQMASELCANMEWAIHFPINLTLYDIDLDHKPELFWSIHNYNIDNIYIFQLNENQVDIFNNQMISAEYVNQTKTFPQILVFRMPSETIFRTTHIEGNAIVSERFIEFYRLNDKNIESIGTFCYSWSGTNESEPERYFVGGWWEDEISQKEYENKMSEITEAAISSETIVLDTQVEDFLVGDNLEQELDKLYQDYYAVNS